MSERLQNAAEILKLERLLGVDAGSFTFLHDVPSTELRGLRESATDSLFDTGAATLARLGAATKLLPSSLVATVAERSFGPLLCARAAGSVEPAKAIDVAKRLSPSFLADATVELDPRRVAAIISGVPTRLVEPVARELGRRGEHVTMGRFLGFVSDDAIVAAMGALSDEAMLRTAFVLEDKDRLDHAVHLLPPERLPGVLVCASENDLWPEALDLLDHLHQDTRGPIADTIAGLGPEVVGRLIDAARAKDLWTALLPVVRTMSESSRTTLAAMPCFHDEPTITEIIVAAAEQDLWVDLVPLLRVLPADVVAYVPGAVTALSPATLSRMLSRAVERADTLIPLLDIVSDMEDAGRATVIEVIDTADRTLGELLVTALTDPEHIRLLLDHVPDDVLAAVERAAERLDLRAGYDAALAAAR